MTDPSPDPEASKQAYRGASTGTPRWVKVSGVIALVVVLLLAIQLIVGGDHGPGRHSSGGDTPPTTVTDVDDASRR